MRISYDPPCGFGGQTTDGGQEAMTYQETAFPFSTTLTKKINSTQNLISTTIFDGLGRSSQTQLNSDPDGATYTVTTYDALGRVSQVYNPTRCNPPTTNCGESTWGLTTYTYDALGRTTQITHPDGSTILTNYTGRATQVQDEGNGTQRVTRISQIDGLGRLTSLCEVAPGPFIAGGGSSSSSLIGQSGSPAACGQDIAGTGFLTTYQYDTLGNLLQVNQGTMAPRTFVYDSLSRLTSATNPESGTLTYAYDPNGNLSTKIAPAPNQTGSTTVTTTYAYDALNRLTQKSYSDGATPAVSYLYDTPPSWSGPRQNAIGRMVYWSTFSCLSMLYDYDPVGRVTGRYEYQPNNCAAFHPLTNTYDLSGNTTSQTDGNFHSATYGYNTAGRLISITDSQTAYPTNLFSGVHYNALGQIVSATTGYGEVESYTYDNRGRENSSTITFNTHPVYSFNITSFAPNGDVLAATDSSNGNWTYNYDAFNRLVGSNQNNGASVYSYVYDRFGNRWQQNGPHAFVATFTGNNPSSPANNNQIDGFTYDAAGNVLNDGTHTYLYDAENRLIQVDAGATAIYTYDGEGHRASKDDTGSVNSGGDTPDPSGTTAFVYDTQGHLVHTEAPNSGTGWRGEVYAGNRHLATYAGNLLFAHSDWLGTERNRDTPNTNGPTYPFNFNLTSLPFGDWLDNSLGLTGEETPLNFTGQYHDFESDLDYFGARYYSSTTGRFISSDWSPIPVPVPYAHLTNPQTLNLYAIVADNPESIADASGHGAQPADEVKAWQFDSLNDLWLTGDGHIWSPNGGTAPITVPENAIWDSGSNGSAAVGNKNKEQFAAMQKETAALYAQANISIQPIYSNGYITWESSGYPLDVVGSKSGYLNVFVMSGRLPGGIAGASEGAGASTIKFGRAYTFIGLAEAEHWTLSHEFAHHFLGDTRPGNGGFFFNIGRDVYINHWVIPHIQRFGAVFNSNIPYVLNPTGTSQ